MPTDLAFKLAARQKIFVFTEWERGNGWWGEDTQSANYFGEHATGDEPFSWMHVCLFKSEEAQSLYPINHVGKQEPSLMMAFCPEAVDMGRFDESKCYSKGVKVASLEYGNEAKEIILRYMKIVWLCC